MLFLAESVLGGVCAAINLFTDRAHLDLGDEARERWGLNHYLGQIENPQIHEFINCE